VIKQLDQITRYWENIRHENESRRKRFVGGDELNVIKELQNEVKRSPGNLETVKLYLELLQLSNNKAVYDKVSLQQIEDVYRKLASICPSDLELNFEYFYFLINVCDKEKVAIKHLKNYQKNVDKMFLEVSKTVTNQ
jgi:hypothetical protein